MRREDKKAAIEMSIGTIVTIVLSISFLVVGIFLISKISNSATSVVDLTDTQLRDQVNKLFSTETRLVIYPQTEMVSIKQEATDGVGIGIKNLLTGAAQTTTFSYTVNVTDASDCGISPTEVEAWIVAGKSDTGIPIASGAYYADKILFRIPVGAPLCTAKFRINVNAGNVPYDTAPFFVTVLAK